MESAAFIGVDDLTGSVDQPAAVQGIIWGMVVNDRGEDLVDGRELLLPSIDFVDVNISFIVASQHQSFSMPPDRWTRG